MTDDTLDVVHVWLSGEGPRCGALGRVTMVSSDHLQDATCPSCRRLLGLDHPSQGPSADDALDEVLARIEELGTRTDTLTRAIGHLVSAFVALALTIGLLLAIAALTRVLGSPL